jgi:hypothetical protein
MCAEASRDEECGCWIKMKPTLQRTSSPSLGSKCANGCFTNLSVKSIPRSTYWRPLHKNLTPWSESENELYRTSDRRLSAKLVPTFADRELNLVSVTDPYGRILGCLDRRYIFFQGAQLYSRGWVDPFQTHYFSENLVAPGSEPDPLDL